MNWQPSLYGRKFATLCRASTPPPDCVSSLRRVHANFFLISVSSLSTVTVSFRLVKISIDAPFSALRLENSLRENISYKWENMNWQHDIPSNVTLVFGNFVIFIIFAEKIKCRGQFDFNSRVTLWYQEVVQYKKKVLENDENESVNRAKIARARFRRELIDQFTLMEAERLYQPAGLSTAILPLSFHLSTDYN